MKISDNNFIIKALTTLTTTFAPLKGEEYYEAICKYIVDNFDIDYSFVGKLNNFTTQTVTVLSGWSHQGPIHTFDYNLKDTPCENVIKNDYALYPENVKEIFPKDELLVTMDIEAYSGIALYNKKQEPIGIFVALRKNRFKEPQKIEHILQMYLGSISAEMERYSNEKNEKDLKNIAYYDPLTKLPNRLLVTDRINHALHNQSRDKSIVAICFMDLDGFKEVNDTLGHAAGDFVLVEVSKRIEEILRPDDTIARLGGDEFVLVLTDIESSEDAARVLLRVLNVVSKQYKYKTKEISHISASIGVTLYPEDNVDSDTLLRHADQAMYKAKENGKNQFYFFDLKEHVKVKANLQALKKIEKGINRGEFELYFQPKLSTGSLLIQSAEVLTRWNHPIIGILSPNEFLPLIENDDIIFKFDEWVIKESLLAMQKIHKLYPSLSLSVNVSAKQFKQKNFVQKIKNIIKELAIDYSILKFIEFEITESSALESINYTNETIESLKKFGIRFALDDFGTGYSSLTHLKELKVNTIKIDKSFVLDMLHTPQDMAITNAIISLSKVFQIEVVAEGVESIEHLLMLFELGCDVVQGYNVAKPITFDSFISFLNDFTPDPKWKISYTYLPTREDFEFLLAQSNHKYWVELVINSLLSNDLSNLPHLSYDNCRFGKWLQGKGKKYFAELPSYNVLNIAHKKMHRVVSGILSSLKEKDAKVSQEDIEHIKQARDELIGIIEELKNEYKNEKLKKGI
jgi:diguanylate cyclase (GGDEF)-like protein